MTKIIANKFNFSLVLSYIIIFFSFFTLFESTLQNAIRLVLLFLFIVVNSNVLLNTQNRIITLTYVIWIVLGFVITFTTSNIRFLKCFIYGIMNICFPYFIYLCFDKKSYKGIFAFSLLLLVISNFINYFSGVAGKDILLRDSDSYTIIYTTVLFVNILFIDLLFNKKRHIFAFFEILLLSLLIFFIITNGFFIALVCIVFGLLGILLSKFSSSKLSIVYYVIFVISCIFIIINVDSIFPWLSSLTNNQLYKDRIGEVYGFIKYGALNGDLNGRINVYKYSVDAIKDYPIIGKIWFVNDSTFIYDVTGFHSTILDNLALFGILGVIPIYLLFSPMYTFYRKYSKKYSSQRRAIISYVFVFLMILLVNNAVSTIGIMSYVCFPYIMMKCQEKEETK